MKKIRSATGHHGGPLAGRRVPALVAGMMLLLTSVLSAEAHAATKPEHNHSIEFIPMLNMSGVHSIQADLYDRNGKRVYHWEKWNVKSSKKVKWTYYSEDPQAWLHMWVRMGEPYHKVFSYTGKPAVCNYQFFFHAMDSELHEGRCLTD